MIAVGCVIFLVISILIVCVLCIYSNRRGLKERDFDDHMPVSARQSMGKFFEKTILNIDFEFPNNIIISFFQNRRA